MPASLVDRFFQPRKCLIAIAESLANCRQVIRRHIAFACFGKQRSQDLFRIVLRSRERQGKAKVSFYIRAACIQRFLDSLMASRYMRLDM